MNLGVSDRTIRYWEAGEKNPDEAIIEKLRTLDIDWTIVGSLGGSGIGSGAVLVERKPLESDEGKETKPVQDKKVNIKENIY